MDVIQLFFFFGSEKVVTRNDEELYRHCEEERQSNPLNSTPVQTQWDCFVPYNDIHSNPLKNKK